MTPELRRRTVLGAAFLLAGGIVAGCSSSSGGGPHGSTSSAAATNASSAATKARSASSLNIGFFTVGNGNPYAVDFNNAVKSEAQAAGAKVTELDSNFDAQTQINQMQQAVARKTYNAWIVTADAGVQECSQVKAAISAGIPVMLGIGHVCNDGETDPNDAGFGQVGFVGVQGQPAYSAWWKTILDQNPDAKVAFFAGPALVDLVQTMKTAEETAFQAHPKAQLISYQNTDWTTQQGYQMAQDLLKAHPDVQVIASSYSYVTKGIMQALQQAGLIGKVKVYDMMGDAGIVDQIKAGQAVLTLPGLPVTEGKDTVDNLVKYWAGKSYPKVEDPADNAAIPGGPYITSTNVANYKAEWSAS